jgi:sec-independent protein translocase protein TatB
MNFGGFSGEMIFIFLLALILFGPKKMPEIGRQVARILNEFRRASNEFRAQIESEVNSLESATKPRQQILPPLQAPLGSLASRIFNPPSAEPREAKPGTTTENSASEHESEHEYASAVETRLAAPAELAKSDAPRTDALQSDDLKVAPDA